MARLLSDGVCNAYLLDVWTSSSYRRRGIATEVIRFLAEKVPGQHIGLQTDNAQELYFALGLRPSATGGVHVARRRELARQRDQSTNRLT